MASESTRLEALRCADHDRELVAQVLNNAYAEGRITFEEHADRIARAYDARTFGDLNDLTTDLVPRTRQVPPAPQPAQPAAAAVATVPGYLPSAADFTGGFHHQLLSVQRIDTAQAHQRHRQGQTGHIEQQAFERFGGPGRTAIGFLRWRCDRRQMHFDDRWHQGLVHFNGRRNQCLQQRRDGRYRRQNGGRCFEHGDCRLRY